MKYTNLWVEFLNNSNTIAIKGVRDFNSLKSLCSKVGLDCVASDYWTLLHLAQINHCAINNTTVLVEYQLGKGFTFGYRSYKESGDWYGQNPWTIKQVLESMK